MVPCLAPLEVGMRIAQDIKPVTYMKTRAAQLLERLRGPAVPS